MDQNQTYQQELENKSFNYPEETNQMVEAIDQEEQRKKKQQQERELQMQALLPKYYSEKEHSSQSSSACPCVGAMDCCSGKQKRVWIATFIFFLIIIILMIVELECKCLISSNYNYQPTGDLVDELLDEIYE